MNEHAECKYCLHAVRNGLTSRDKFYLGCHIDMLPKQKAEITYGCTLVIYRNLAANIKNLKPFFLISDFRRRKLEDACTLRLFCHFN